MNAHVQIDTAAPATITAAPSLSRLLQAHQTIADLISALPAGSDGELRATADVLLWDISQARATSWDEFGRKVQLLVDQTTEESDDLWLTAVQEGVYWDLKQLNGETAAA